MSIKRIVHTVYKDEEKGFEYTFEPVEESIQVEETPDGYKVKYLVRDKNPQSPAEWSDDNVFLVHYHRDFWIESKVATEDILRDWYQHNIYGYGVDTPEELKEYYVFPVSALIHSGVWLRLHHVGFAEDGGGWDTSHVGAVCIHKSEHKTEQDAEKLARVIVDNWNMYLSGDVYGCVVETFDKDKNSVDQDSCWDYYGFDYAMEALKNGF